MLRSVVLPEQTVDVSSLQPCYKLCLNDGHISDIPEHSYLIRLVVGDLPEALESVDIMAGPSRIKLCQREDLVKGENLISIDDSRMEMSKFYYTSLTFNYNKEFVTQNERFEMVDEYTKQVTFSDTELEYFDGEDYCFGLRVYRNMVPTGQKVRKIIKGAQVVIPRLLLVVLDRS